MRKFAAAAAALIAALMLAGCVNTRPIIHGGVSPEQTGRAAINTAKPREDDAMASEFVPTPKPEDESGKDALGNTISGSEHFTRYLTFRTMLVYEEDQDTFLDGIIYNDYPKAITCAIDIVYDDDEGAEIARARLQTRDGKYLLVLSPGENVIFAHILTDMTLTDREYTMEFDKEIGIRPID